MKLHCALFLLLTAASLSSQEAKPSPEVVRLLRDAYEFQQKKQYADALDALDKLETLAPDLPDLHNMRGALYVSPALRDFEKAQSALERAAALQPDAVAPKFNQAELLFVKHDWEGARSRFQNLLDTHPKLPMELRHLALFKRLICEVKLGQEAKAEQTLKENFNFMDDTPAYYYGHAALAFGRKDENKAKEWMSRAESIYKADTAAPYADSLMEVRWVPNISLPPIQPE